MEAWTITIGLLQSDAAVEAKMFGATTLKGKVGCIRLSVIID